MPKVPNDSQTPFPLEVTPDLTEVTFPGQVITFEIDLLGSGIPSDETNVVVSPVGGAPLTLASGDVNGDGILETSETWVYFAQHVVTAADLASTPSTLTFQFASSGTTTAGVDPHFGEVNISAVGPLRVTNLFSADGGAHWFAGTSLVTTPGTALLERFVVENVGPDPLTNITIADSRISLSSISVGPLSPGGVFQVTVQAGTAVYGAPAATDVFSVHATFGSLGVVGATSVGSYSAFSDATFQQGPVAHDVAYWASHPNAWAPYLVNVVAADGSHQQGIWLGVVDPTISPADQGALFIPHDVVRQLLNAAGSADDLRLTVAGQAIAAQFNVDAGVHIPGGGGEPGAFQDLLSEAVAFLYGTRAGFEVYQYQGASISGQDATPTPGVAGLAGFLSAGPKNSFDFNTKTDAFSSPATALDSPGATAPHPYASVDYGDFQATGVGLASALNLFNTNHLVTDPLGQTVAWDDSGQRGGPYTHVGLNGPEDFWSVLHAVTTGTGLFTGIL